VVFDAEFDEAGLDRPAALTINHEFAGALLRQRAGWARACSHDVHGNGADYIWNRNCGSMEDWTLQLVRGRPTCVLAKVDLWFAAVQRDRRA